jgi:eukaryotic-like serine/threonine-protein kinase
MLVSMKETVSPDLSSAVLQPHDRLGPYEIRDVLGSGGLGTVYRAWDGRLDREVALKVLAEGAEATAGSLADLEREARLLASLSHPNVVGIFDVGEDGGRRYVATELLAGVNLRQRMAGGPLPWRTAVAIVLEATKGLAAAHARGIVHRDLKPENIFVLSEGGVKILDFGLAQREPGLPATDASRAGRHADGEREVAGTTTYLAPEQLAGGPVDHRSDIFSLGSVLFEVLSGRAPFQRGTLRGTLGAIAAADLPPLKPHGLTIPPGLRRIVRTCLEKDPRKRFPTAYDLAFALSEQLAGPSALDPGRREWRLKLGYFLAGAATALACLFLLRLILR